MLNWMKYEIGQTRLGDIELPRIERKSRDNFYESQVSYTRGANQADSFNQEATHKPRSRVGFRNYTSEERPIGLSKTVDNIEVVDLYSQPAGYRPQTAESLNNSAAGKRTTVRVSNNANRSSQEANILTWSSPNQANNRNLVRFSSNVDLMKANNLLATAPTGSLRKIGEDYPSASLVQGPSSGTRFCSPQKIGESKGSVDVGEATQDSRLLELTQLIDKVD